MDALLIDEHQRQQALVKARQRDAATHAVAEAEKKITRLDAQRQPYRDQIALARSIQPLADRLPADVLGFASYDARGMVQSQLGAILADRTRRLEQTDAALTAARAVLAKAEAHLAELD